MVEGLGDTIKGLHVLGKSNKAAKADLERATGGNDLCFVSSRGKVPKTLKKHTLYVFLNEDNSLTISSHKKQDIIVNEVDLPDGAVLRLKEAVNNFDEEPSLDDTQALFKYARKEKILDKTLREKTLRAGAEVAAVGLTVAEGAATLVAGREYAPKGLRDTTVRKTVKKGKKDFGAALDSTEVGKKAKAAAIAADRLHSKATSEVAAVVATPLSAVSGAVMGRESAVPVPDSKFKDHVVQPVIDAADKKWDEVKEAHPDATGTVERALDAKNQFVHSEFVSQGISMAGGTTAALGGAAGVGFTAPFSIPALAVVTVASVSMSVNAETKRQALGREKHYLEDIAVNAHRVETINKKFPNISQTLDIPDTADDHLRKMERPTSKTIGPNHSFAENGVAMTAAIHTPFVFVKAATAVSSPVALTLHGIGLVNAVTTQVSGKFSETDAKHQVRSEVDTLRQIIPKNMDSNNIYVLANNAIKMKVEAAALEAVAEQFEKNPSLHEEDMVAIFKNAKKAEEERILREEEERVSKGKHPIYSSQNLTRPDGVMDQMGEHAQNTGKVLFGKKTTYQQNAGFSPEVEDIVSQLRPSFSSSDTQVAATLVFPMTVVAEDPVPIAVKTNDNVDRGNAQVAVKPVAVQGVVVAENIAKAIPIPSDEARIMRKNLEKKADISGSEGNDRNSLSNKKSQRRASLGRVSSYSIGQ